MAGISSYTEKNDSDLSASDETYRPQRKETLKRTAADPTLARAYLLKASMLADPT